MDDDHGFAINCPWIAVHHYGLKGDTAVPVLGSRCHGSFLETSEVNYQGGYVLILTSAKSLLRVSLFPLHPMPAKLMSLT